MTLRQKAKTLAELVETCDFIRKEKCRNCFAQCEFEGTEHFKGYWVRLEDAEKEVEKIRDNFVGGKKL